MTLDPPQTKWNVPATYKLMGAERLEGPWEVIGEDDGGGSGHATLPGRFFNVEVVLP